MCLLKPKEEVVKLQSFDFRYLPIEGLLHSAYKKSQKVLVTVFFFFFFFLVYFAVLSLVFELKQNLEAQPYPEMSPEPPKRLELLWSSMGKIISSLYPYCIEPGSGSNHKDC